MLQLLRGLFDNNWYMPHIHCYRSDGGLTWLHVVSDSLIGLSYVAISLTLVYMVYRARREIPFHAMFLMFGVFIVACGGTHFMEILTLWTAAYWASGGVKAVTAIASVATAVALPPLVPMALQTVSAARVSESRRADLERANEELQELNRRLREFDQLKTDFFASVSHELRTPLTLILGPARRLREQGVLTAAQAEDVTSIENSARLLLRHVNDLLDLAKLEARKMELKPERVDLALLVRTTAGYFETLAADRETQLQVEATGPLPAEVDADKLQRVLMNLLSNALKFSPAGGRVRCSLLAPGASGEEAGILTLEVADSGPGIPAHLRTAIFERFRQVESGNTREFGGTGLGLAIVKDFVELHNGEVTVEDAPEGGALFRVRLPQRTAPFLPEEGWEADREQGQGGSVALAPMTDAPSIAETMVRELTSQPVSAQRTDTAAPTAPAAEAASMEGITVEAAREKELPRVLVVEDNPDLRRLVVSLLEEDYQVEAAADGQEGLERAEARVPDLVVSDLMMPRLNGEQLLRRLRERPALEETPVLMLTARADDELRVGLLRAGAQDYVLKPFSPDELRVRVRNLVTIHRARRLLQEELELREGDLAVLAVEVRQRARDLATALDTAEVARESAERSSQVKSTFLRMVSHELRTPLTSLLLQNQLLERNRDGTLTPKQLDMVRKIGFSGRRLQDLIESLLEHVRIEAGKLTVSPERFNVAQVAAETVEENQFRATQKGLELRLSGVDVPLEFHSDLRLVRLIMVNLLDNALKYTESGHVHLRLASVTLLRGNGPVQGIAIAVSDTGAGIDTAQQTRIFEAFEQLEPVNRKHLPGVGLGLALVREMAEAMGGTVSVQSALGEGSTFEVVLPSYPEEAA